MEVRWSETAIEMADQVLQYTYEEFGERQVSVIVNRFADLTEQLQHMPNSGQKEPTLTDQSNEYRYLLVNPELKLLYYIENQTVNIAAVWNVRQSARTIALQLRINK